MKANVKAFFHLFFVFTLILASILTTTTTPQAVETEATVVTVAQAIASNSGQATVEGYVVGVTNSGPVYVFDKPFSVDSNVAIADSPGERQKLKIFPVQLPSGPVRTGLNLKAHPELLGKKIRITGSLEPYFGVPGMKNASSYEVVGGGGTDPNPAPVVLSIQDARTKTSQSVTVEGVITADNDAIGAGKLSTFIQDDTAGINLFASSLSGMPKLTEGDRIRVTGTIQSYKGLIDIVPESGGGIQVLAANQPLPEPKILTIADLNDASAAEPYEGCLITVIGYVNQIPGQSAGGGYNVSILDDQFNSTTLRVMEGTGAISSLQSKTWFSFTGILGQFDSYQLLPRKASDVEKLKEQKPAPKPLTGYSSKVGSIVDGDTIHLSVPVLGANKVRFVDVDTPETYHTAVTEADRNQKEQGEAAKAYLNSLLRVGDEVEVRVSKEPFDNYGRLLAQIIRKSDGMNINLQMVKKGYAVTYFIWPIDEEDYGVYSQAVKQAKNAGLGIWNPNDPLMELPFVFRAREQNKGLTRYVGHHEQKYYVEPKDWESIPVEYRVFFASVEEAEQAGYERYKTDNTAPTTDVQLSPPPNAEGWLHEDTSVSLKAKDDKTGVADTMYKIGNGVWTSYSSAILVNQEGATALYYYSRDKAGNVENEKTLELKLDKTAPAYVLTQSGGSIHDVVASDILRFELRATDGLSGVKRSSLTLDNQVVATNENISAASLALGTHTLNVEAEDVAGNVTTGNFTFKVGTSWNTITSLINQFLQAGEIKNKGIATSIQVKLDTAKYFHNQGKIDQAKKHVYDLKQTIKSYTASGKISQQAGSVLITHLDYLFASMK